jgi:simple sugar transport system ATP-binding protein
MMVGEKVAFSVDKPDMDPGKTVMRIENISVLNDRGREAVRNISLELRQNEITGVAGIAGNGQNELCEAIVGLRKPVSGKIYMFGKDLTSARPKAFISEGVRYIPADRKGTGLIPNMNINENAILKKYWQKPVSRGFRIDWRAVLDFAKTIVEKFHVDAPSLETPVRNLSGGNLQKLMLGRELKDEPNLLVAVHPTWGLDVAATTFVRETLLLERSRGASILFVSEDLSELVSISDRLAVIHGGEFMGMIDDPSSIDLETVGLMMAGTPASEIFPEVKS